MSGAPLPLVALRLIAKAHCIGAARFHPRRAARARFARALPLRAPAAAPPPAPPAAAGPLRGPALPPSRRSAHVRPELRPAAAPRTRAAARAAHRLRGPPAPAARLPPRDHRPSHATAQPRTRAVRGFHVQPSVAARFPLGARHGATLRRRLVRPHPTTRAPTGLHPIMRALCDAGLRRLGSAFYITALCKFARLHTRTRRGLSSFPQAFICGTLHPPLAVRSRLWQLRAAARSAGALRHPPPRAPAHALRGPALPPPNPRAGRPAAPRGTATAHDAKALSLHDCRFAPPATRTRTSRQWHAARRASAPRRRPRRRSAEARLAAAFARVPAGSRPPPSPRSRRRFATAASPLSVGPAPDHAKPPSLRDRRFAALRGTDARPREAAVASRPPLRSTPHASGRFSPVARG